MLPFGMFDKIKLANIFEVKPEHCPILAIGKSLSPFQSLPQEARKRRKIIETCLILPKHRRDAIFNVRRH